MNQDYCAVILAAGFSSRMGALKPLLPVGGVPAIRRVAETVRSAGVAPVVVTGHRAGEVAAALAGSGAVLVENRSYADGMFSSVLAGVAALPDTARAFFLLPGDCCAILPETLTGLIKAFEGLKTTVYPTFDSRRGHPPVIPYALAAALLEYGGEGGTKGFLAQYPSAELPVPDAGILLDMDTPRDYADMLRSLNLAPDMPDGA